MDSIEVFNDKQALKEYEKALDKLSKRILELYTKVDSLNVLDIYKEAKSDWQQLDIVSNNYEKALIYDINGKIRMKKRLLESSFNDLFNEIALLWPEDKNKPLDKYGHLQRRYTMDN